jgi:hypothetical protein
LPAGVRFVPVKVSLQFNGLELTPYGAHCPQG